jgi:nucleotide-binding universal stress UspA family protein
MAIVVGADGSDESQRALRWAIEEARLRNSTVRAVMAWDYPPLLGAADPFFVGAAPEPPMIDPRDLEQVARTRLAEAVEAVTDEPDLVSHEFVQGQAADCLLEAAKEAELLVVGSRGHGGFTELLLGSVSQACAQHATCPVVIVRR